MASHQQNHHDAEFGSDVFLAKLRQSTSQNAARDGHGSDTSLSPFILPLRGVVSESGESLEARDTISEFKRAEKTSKVLRYIDIFGDRDNSKKLESDRRVKSQPKRKSKPLDQLFINLPNEIQAHILSSLPLSDILNLRLVSKLFHAAVTLQEGPIARYHLQHHIPAYARRLYPPSGPAEINLHYLCSLWHRLHVAAKLAHLMCEWATKEIFLRTSEAQKREFAPQRERMRRRLIPIIFTLFHFFETYRKVRLANAEQGNIGSPHQIPSAINPVEAQIMNVYDDRTLLKVHQVFPFVIASFCRRMRPPTYTGRVERSFRGYFREKPSDQVHAAILCIGGLRQVEKLWEIKVYNQRRSAIDDWYRSLGGNLVEAPSTPKPRRTFMSLGRKKSMALGDVASRPSNVPVPPLPDTISSDTSVLPDFFFNTSLIAGMPMKNLPQDRSLVLLSNLPSLQEIWLVTAEALILERRIVERAQDIKRNSQVLLELIREDGFEEEDEWWYGCGASESLRPPADATEDDPEGI